ncbi:hypothetical protein VC74_gp89 [Mycobacterium phage Sparky]|uniref:Uncharacterized protein n=2 Tax=Caudoviricetes TaxID=2731619 RepID=A0A076G7T2_9CAUD|nr:hypothetical protein VC74_gp89 [Mycobacterium phage Sparky]AII28181.1 hypothetical protein PBI_SPARKY_37 [Mycobacterium phage Sparky]
MDARAQQAREHHRKAGDASRVAEQHRAQRDELIRSLWATERDRWTYAKLAKAVGCSPELIAKIISSGAR